MDSVQLSSVEAAYFKVKGIDIFRFKAYFEKTNGLAEVWVVLSEFFVNLPFMLLNLVVMLFSVAIKLFETLDIYNTYKVLAYNVSKDLWFRLNGTGNYTNSCLFIHI